MMSKIAVVLVLVAMLMVGQTEAYKSLRNRRYKSTEESEAIHQQRHADKVKVKDHMDHENEHHNNIGDDYEVPTRLYKSESYQFAWGPEYPEHDQDDETMDIPSVRYHDGEEIPDFISDEEFRENFH